MQAAVADGLELELPRPGRAPAFVRSAKADLAPKIKVFDEFLTQEGGTGWIGQLLSGESRYAGSESLERPYEESGWVHVALKHIATAVKSCPLRFYVEDPRDNPDAKLIPANHRLNTLFARPNPIATFGTFIEAGVIHRKLDGEDFWFLFTSDKYPVKSAAEDDGVVRFDWPDFIMPVRGNAVVGRQDRYGFPAIWEFPTKGKAINFPAGSVVQFKDYDPANPNRGLGDVQVLMRDLTLEFGAQRYLEAMLRHSGDPGGYIITEDELNKEGERRAEQQAAERFSPDNAGRWRVISGKGVKYEAARFGPKDMEYKALLAHVAQKVASVLGVPLPVMGILDEATYSNYGTAVEQFWRNGNGVLAYLSTVEEGINRNFLQRLRDKVARTFVARFDTSHVEALREDNLRKITAAKELASANIGVSFDEGAKLHGLTGIKTEFGGVAWVPPNITTASEALAHAEEAEASGRAEEQVNGQPGAAGTSSEEPDDFPGSNDFESGSNGPTGSDGKAQAGRRDHRSDDATARRSSDDGPPDHAREARVAYFKTWEAGVLRPGERRVRMVTRDFLASYARAAVKKIEQFAKEGEPGGLGSQRANPISPRDVLADEELMNILLLAHAEWVAKLANKLQVPLEEVLNAAADDIARELAAGQAITASDPWALDYLRGQRIRLAEGVTSKLAQDVKKALVEVFERAPFDMATLQEHVRKLLPEIQGALRKVFANRTARASAIARTEVNRAANGARYETMQRESVEKHQWVTSGDDAVRTRPPFSHLTLDGAIVNVGDSFREGFTLRFPHDPYGAAGDVVNCRCVTRPIVKD